MEKVCIIGGGAAGLFCANHIKGKQITIIEMAEDVGKKILATGNGRCNLSNLNMNKCSYNHDLVEFFSRFTTKQTLEYFNSIGLEMYSDEEGRVYPLSNTATSVLAVLKNNLSTSQNLKITTNKPVIAIKKQKNGYYIEFSDGDGEFFDKVVVASGNKTKLNMFDKLNIKYKNFTPSLCSILTEKHKPLEGVRVGNVCAKCPDVSFEEIGEVLFRENGISGIVIFNLSSYFSRAKISSCKFSIDFMYNTAFDNLVNLLKRRRVNLSYLKVEEFLTGIFHKRINYEILLRAKVNMCKNVHILTDAELHAIANVIKNFELTYKGKMENNQVCHGGVLLSELDENLQCKKHNGLYFIGEVVDIDGLCGGYNLQWAWTSAKIVGDSI